MKCHSQKLECGELGRLASLALACCVAALVGACSTASTPRTQLATLRITMNPMCKASQGPAPGKGTVTFSPAPIGSSATCVLKESKPAECAPQFPLGARVTLTAAPATAFDGFDGFVGSGCSGIAKTCTTTMDSEKQVTAHFCNINIPH